MVNRHFPALAVAVPLFTSVQFPGSNFESITIVRIFPEFHSFIQIANESLFVSDLVEVYPSTEIREGKDYVVVNDVSSLSIE